MSSTSSRTQFNTEEFLNWKNSNECLLKHETLKNHFNALIAFKDRSIILGRINVERQQQIEQDKFFIGKWF